MDDREWRVHVVERAVASGRQDPADSGDVRANGRVTRPGLPPPGTVPLAAGAVPLACLLRHAEAHYSEYQLRNDLDCALALCGSEGDRAEVRRFARAKLAGKSYRAPDGSVGLESVHCGQCGKPFAASRSTARFCSAGCRMKAHRRNP